jgi:hypothetical protein
LPGPNGDLIKNLSRVVEEPVFIQITGVVDRVVIIRFVRFLE